MGKSIIFTEAELIRLHFIIVEKYDVDGGGAEARARNNDPRTFETTQSAHRKIQYALARPDRTGEDRQRVLAALHLNYDERPKISETYTFRDDE